jgi:hypothetical protein
MPKIFKLVRNPQFISTPFVRTAFQQNVIPRYGASVQGSIIIDKKPTSVIGPTLRYHTTTTTLQKGCPNQR